ncbi:DUF748 domain-containing protein [Parahaliea sp. F7430]|uniref:DUF748 domain-containing protein n=1 Tax=Sediminihaliea albiluteola TaxID=2758564 RepID=A0A7W2TVE6_9GAMM|nr:DUF748 domain-containing protein [Sediminihaliea albiluteola]MBA6412603.1 DUF748 domain-containing protein [Sediminihaliea albiluteola]
MKTALRIIAALYLVYLALSILLIMPLLNTLPHWFIKQQYQRDFSSELVIFNPFKLSLEVHKAKLDEADGGDFASIDRLSLNLSTSGLWREGWVLDELSLLGLNLHLQRYTSGKLNIDDFLPQPAEQDAPSAQQEDPSAIPGLSIELLELSAERIRLSDAQRQTPYSTYWDALHIRAKHLSTVAVADEPYQIELQDESGGSLKWHGELSLPAAHSSGRITLSGVALQPFWRYVREQLDFELNSGQLYLSADYDLNWSEALRFNIDQGSLELKQLNLEPKDAAQLPDTAVSFSSLKLDEISVNSSQELLNIARASLNGLSVSGWLEEQQLSLMTMFNTRFFATTENDSDSEDSPSTWQFAVQTAAIEEAEIFWRSAYTSPERLHVAPLNIKVDAIHWPAQADSHLSLDLQINEEFSSEVLGNINLASGDGELSFNLKDLPIPWFAPNIPAQFTARLSSGSAALNGALSLQAFTPQKIQVDGQLQDLAIAIDDAEQSVTSWDMLEWKELVLDLPSQRIDLAQLHLDGYAGRIHIREDGSLNLQHLISEQAQASNTEEASEQHTAASAEQAADSEANSGWSFAAPAIHLSNSEVDFMDESLPIRFRTIIGDLSGSIIGLDSDPDKSLSVDIKGSVDGYAPVVLKGSASPLHQPPILDLALNFQGVDLARLTPYSGTYAGYAIDRGILNLDLKYSLEDERLQGDNKVLIKQLKLGKKVDSDKALNIPLQLGLALLTDANGVIDLDVPVSGNVKDPEFGLGSVIFGAFANLITKAISSPFTLLAKLVGTKDDLQQIRYAAGSKVLDEHSQEKLLELAQALQQRPALKLVIKGRIEPQTDRAKLQQELLRAELIAAGLSAAEIDGKSEAWAAAIAKRFAALASNSNSESDQQDVTSPSATVQARKVQEQINVPSAALKALAEERAASTKRFLVTEGGIAADRAVIEPSDPMNQNNSFSGVEMSVDT